MISIQDYEKLYEMQNKFLSMNLYGNDHPTFAQQFGQIIDETLGFKYSMFGYLADQDHRILTPACMIHGVSMEFTQTFFLEYWENEEKLLTDEDRILFSRLPEPLKTHMYKNVLNPFKFADCTIEFVRTRDGDKYMSQLILLSDKKPFTDDDLMIVDKLKESMVLAEANFIRVWNLKNQNSMIINCTNYFPIGIMLIENTNIVTFANKTAKEYLSDLGVKSEKLYSTFFTNMLMKYCKYDLLTFGSAKPVRINNYLFSVVAVGNPGENLENQLFRKDHPESMLIDTMDASMVVYIINDDLYHTRFDASQLEQAGLTKREIDVAELIAAGKSNQEIAEQLVISSNTVRIHISNIFRKMDVRSRAQLVDKLLNINT